MKKIKEIPAIKQGGILNKQLTMNASLASILKLGLAVAQFEQSKFILLPKEIMIII